MFQYIIEFFEPCDTPMALKPTKLGMRMFSFLRCLIFACNIGVGQLIKQSSC
jgi:hypothetical protein